MKKTELNIGAMRMVSIGQMFIFFLLAAFSVCWAEQENPNTTAKCLFTKYLEKPENRSRYVYTLAKARATYAQKNNYDNAAMYGVIVKANYGAENGENLDSFSAGCLSCHDGSTASNVRVSFKNDPNNNSGMQKISGKHPIGMDYEQYSVVSSSLKSLDEMSQNLTLVEGRVSCITCHDPLNADRNHVTLTRSGIDLCSACHSV